MKIKVCGLKDPGNIKQVAELAPAFIGFIFYPFSSRYVGEGFIMPALPGNISKVGVFVNARPDHIIDMVDSHRLDAVQLHGNEKPEFCEVLSHITTVIKAFGVDAGFDFSTVERYEGACQYFLFDTKTDTFGGSGRSFDHALLNAYRGRTPFFLSGGISVEDVKANHIAHPSFAGFDLNSKFEIAPGLKSIELLKAVLVPASYPWRTSAR